MKKTLWQRLRHRMLRMRIHPIRVFVFHQVSEVFEPDTMWECDWSNLDDFKRSILSLKKQYRFISLTKARMHLNNDKIRLNDYAALTADDGWSSLKNVLPWLAEQRIPITLFLNPSCLDGQHYHSRDTDKLLTEEDIRSLVKLYHPFITIASHGWTHRDCTTMTMEEFMESFNQSETALQKIGHTVPFYAYASGRSTPEQTVFLKNRSIVPVFVDGMKNEMDSSILHRECIDGRSF